MSQTDLATEFEGANERPDLYIGLVCAAGTDLTEVKNQLKAQLSIVGYSYQEIKVSRLIGELLEVGELDDEYLRTRHLMLAGDCIRQVSENGNGVAGAIIAAIRQVRRSDTAPQTTAFVIDSLKNPAEIDLLDQVYGRNYYTVSVFRPRDDRITNLQNKIAKKRHQPPDETHTADAKKVIREDEKGIGKKSQNVQDTFPRADFFVNATEDVTNQLQRFVGIVFQDPFVTPTVDEYAMSVARTVALRSCDLSRQVGAVILDRCRTVLATGCNEVPYPGGGIYYNGRSGAIGDNRDYKKGHDPNYIEIQRTLIEFIGVLRLAGQIKTGKSDADVADSLLHGQYKELMSNARIRNLIEFGRVVHAEMHALSQAAGQGRSVRNAVLYCTTFPCHGCARHIIASGISEVVFIEPYPKSLTQRLYADEIEMVDREPQVDPEAPIDRVRFRPFHGVAPMLYQRAFTRRDRKDRDGTIASWEPLAAEPVGAIYGIERPSVELTASKILADRLDAARAAYNERKGEIDSERADASRPVAQ